MYIVAELAAVELAPVLRPVAVVLQIALLAVQFVELLPLILLLLSLHNTGSDMFHYLGRCILCLRIQGSLLVPEL